MPSKPKGRPKKYDEYETWVKSLPTVMKKRAMYMNGIGVFRGATGDTAWIKIHVPHGGSYQGKTYRPGSTPDIKLGHLSSWSWEQNQSA